MKILAKIFLALVIFILGYALGNVFPWSGFSFSEGENIYGSAKLEVTLQMDSGQPVADVEVDLAEKPVLMKLCPCFKRKWLKVIYCQTITK